MRAASAEKAYIYQFLAHASLSLVLECVNALTDAIALMPIAHSRYMPFKIDASVQVARYYDCPSSKQTSPSLYWLVEWYKIL